MRAIFLRALHADDKARALRVLAKAETSVRARDVFGVEPARFLRISTSPFAYWAPSAVLDLFGRFPPLSSLGRIARTTNPTTDDFRFARGWWEVDPVGTFSGRWRSWNKGGGYSPFHRDIDLVIDWDRNRETYRGYLGTIYRPDVRPANVDYFGRPGLTWGYRGHRLCFQAMPSGTVISTRGNGYYGESDLLLFDLGLLNSVVADYLVKLTLGRGDHPQFDIGDISTIPAPPTDREVPFLARRAYGLRRSLDTRTEVSHTFVLPALLQVEGDSLAARGAAWAARVRAVVGELDEIQAEIDERCFDLYEIDDADRRAISEGLAGGTEGFDSEESAGEVEEADGRQDAEAAADAAGLAAALVSWAVGVAFGRFDVRLATGEREFPAEPDPFDPLPVCSPAMLVGDDGLPATSAPPGYPVDFAASGVLVDDPGDPRDLTAAVRAVFDAVFGASADALWNEAAALLDPRGHDLRVWLRSAFFERHLKLYSKSRRKAPILWQLGTVSGRYSIWLYAHRLTDDSFFWLQNDVLAPKLAYEERQLTNLLQRADPSARERREIAAQEAFVEELRALVEEVKRVAPLWRPTLDDGVVLAMAPLWRPVPHKPWQRELKKKWSELAAGKYDWAQLAMQLWPERVVPTCGEDRSLAIAHGLEDVFWLEDEDGKWQRRREPTTAVEDLILERTSAATKDALNATA